MADASPTQASFLGGEWSPYAQGRIDDPAYAAALATSQNALIGVEGSWHRRSGTQRLWNIPFTKDAIFKLVRTDGLPIICVAGPLDGQAHGGIMLFAPGGLTTPGTYNQGTTPLLQKDTWYPVCDSYNPGVSYAATVDGGASFTVSGSVANWVVGDQIVFLRENGTVSTDTFPELMNYIFQIRSISGHTITVYNDRTQQILSYANLTPGAGFNGLFVGHIWRGNGPYFGNHSKPVQTNAELVKQMKVVQASNNLAYFFTRFAPPWVLNFGIAPGNAPVFQNAGFCSDQVNGTIAGADGPYNDPPNGASQQGNGLSTLVNVSSNTYTFTITDGSYSFNWNSSYTDVGLDIGRAIRVWSQPPAWNSSTAYTVGQVVSYPPGVQGGFWQCVVANTGTPPGQLITQSSGVVEPAWFPNPNLAGWAYGVVSAISNTSTATVIMYALPQGPSIATLLNQNGSTLDTYQLGTFHGPDPAHNDTNGLQTIANFPTCGLYHEGRLWMAGAVPNRIDTTMTEGPINNITPKFIQNLQSLTPTAAMPRMSPTDGYGNVLDDSGLSLLMNSDTMELAQWMAVDHMGVIIGTLDGEWLCFASQLNDPITPTSVQIHKASRYGGNFVQPIFTGLAHIFAQRYGRFVEEYIADVFSQRFSARPINEMAQHLTTAGIIGLAYHETPLPMVWALMADGSIASCLYRRKSYFVSEDPLYKAWCSHKLPANIQVNAICTAPMPEFNIQSLFTSPAGFGGGYIYNSTDGFWQAPTFPNDSPPCTAEALFMITQTGLRATASTYNAWLEFMRPRFEANDALTRSFFLDGAIAGGTMAWNVAGPGAATLCGTILIGGVRFTGLRSQLGNVVRVFAMGLDCGTYTVDSNGAVFVPWGADPFGSFTQANIALLGGFVSDRYASFSCPVGLPGQQPPYDVPVVIGQDFTSIGTRLRVQAQNELRLPSGPGIAKKRRTHMLGGQVVNAFAVTFSFDNQPGIPYQFIQPDGATNSGSNPTGTGPYYLPFTTALGYTGIIWTQTDADANFDNQMTWTIAGGPYPFTLLNVAQFMNAEER